MSQKTLIYKNDIFENYAKNKKMLKLFINQCRYTDISLSNKPW